MHQEPQVVNLPKQLPFQPTQAGKRTCKSKSKDLRHHDRHSWPENEQRKPDTPKPLDRPVPSRVPADYKPGKKTGKNEEHRHTPYMNKFKQDPYRFRMKIIGWPDVIWKIWQCSMQNYTESHGERTNRIQPVIPDIFLGQSKYWPCIS